MGERNRECGLPDAWISKYNYREPITIAITNSFVEFFELSSSADKSCGRRWQLTWQEVGSRRSPRLRCLPDPGKGCLLLAQPSPRDGIPNENGRHCKRGRRQQRRPKRAPIAWDPKTHGKG